MEGISTLVDLNGGYEVRFTTRRRSEFESIKEACVSLVQRRGPMRRFDYLQSLPPEMLADYLEHELSSGIPTDWLKWLGEEVP